MQARGSKKHWQYSSSASLASASVPALLLPSQPQRLAASTETATHSDSVSASQSASQSVSQSLHLSRQGASDTRSP